LTLRLALLVAIVAIAAAPVFSQASYRSIVRTATDRSSAAVVGGTVSLTNAGTGERRQSKSGTGSNYQLLNLVPGIYRVNMEHTGFKKSARENVICGDLRKHGSTYYDGVPADLALGDLVKLAPSPDPISEFRVEAEVATAADEATRLDVNLKVGAVVRKTVEVAAQAAQIQLDTNAATNGTDGQVINDVPNVTQNFFLTPCCRKASAEQRDVHQHFRRSINDRQSVSAS